MGGTLASEILAGALIGWLLDALFGTKPILLIVMTIAGVLAHGRLAVRGARREASLVLVHRRDVVRLDRNRSRRRQHRGGGFGAHVTGQTGDPVRVRVPPHPGTHRSDGGAGNAVTIPMELENSRSHVRVSTLLAWHLK